MVKCLPTFQGYTVDVRLREFRKITSVSEIEFVNFDSPKGDMLLEGFLDTLDANNKEDLHTLTAIW
jgi:hypothetical protein